jgi:peptide/nickel transport system ATP-binding protein
MCDRIAVINGGRIIELAGTEQIFRHPREDYTRELLAASHIPPRPEVRPEGEEVTILKEAT